MLGMESLYFAIISLCYLAIAIAIVHMRGTVTTTFLMSSGLSCSVVPTMILRRSSAIAVMEMVDTKTEVACSRPIMRQAT